MFSWCEWGINCINLLCFGSFAGAGAHHEGGQKIANCLEVDFPAQRYVKFPRMQWDQILAAWLLG